MLLGIYQGLQANPIKWGLILISQQELTKARKEGKLPPARGKHVIVLFLLLIRMIAILNAILICWANKRNPQECAHSSKVIITCHFLSIAVNGLTLFSIIISWGRGLNEFILNSFLNEFISKE